MSTLARVNTDSDGKVIGVVDWDLRFFIDTQRRDAYLMGYKQGIIDSMEASKELLRKKQLEFNEYDD